MNKAISANVHCKIDNIEVPGSLTKIDIPARNSKSTLDVNIGFQLSGLAKGKHNLIIELISLSNPNLVYDSWEFSFTIINEYTIPTLIVNPISSFNQTSALGGGYISSDGGSSIISRGVCWATSENPTIANEHSSDGPGTGRFISNMPNLKPGTKYFVRAYATNSVGTGYSTNQVSFTTQPASLS